MSDKKEYYTIEEFRGILSREALEMKGDERLQNAAKKLLIDADHYRWIHQTSWKGIPVLQTPQDLIQIQDIVFRTKPETIIEVGVAWGGLTQFLCDLQKFNNGNPYWKNEVIAIDIRIPERVGHNDNLICYEHSSLDLETFEEIKEKVKNERVLVILDSHHTHAHVLQELRLYSQLLKKGDYLICGDTWADELSSDVAARKRPWGPGNSPRSALNQFLAEWNGVFERDEEIQNKLLISCNPDGYIYKV